VPIVAPVLVKLGRLGRNGDPEINEVREVVLGHQDVRRFDVAVHQPDAVGGVEGTSPMPPRPNSDTNRYRPNGVPSTG
jgi:hypothetical protein